MKNKNLAKRVKELRKRKGLSQEELTENSGLSLRTVQRIENGETDPTGETLRRIADALKVNPDELIDWTIKEDTSFLKFLNLSALTFIFFPILGIIVPLIMWVSKKDKIKDINKIAKSVINFQITWSILVFLFPIAILVIRALTNEPKEGETILLGPALIIIFLIFMYGLNFIFTIVNTYRIHKEKDIKYFPKIKFLR
ncbi:helix-turn-helix domain-containing protein [Zobellia uliginosa]|uniref:helix-turn-helix domain-containing protein n=1 Tax=Zobellia uliginosa TaxID=143224 RepID=UPI0026E421CA|nr:helix-turn-helix domain-containing protein [Zobellia uliginosa]MDO6517727.1 helix-turn-helix domain-containing protein [Zobellia uliginosa]